MCESALSVVKSSVSVTNSTKYFAVVVVSLSRLRLRHLRVHVLLPTLSGAKTLVSKHHAAEMNSYARLSHTVLSASAETLIHL